MAEQLVIVLGAGGHAKVVIDLLRKLGRTILAAVEEIAPAGARRLLDVPVEGEDFIARGHGPETVELALGIGMPTTDPIAGLAARRAVAARFEARGYRFPPLIHPAAVVGADCKVEDGAQVMAGAVLQPACAIGRFAIVNTGARVDHDCTVGEGSHIAPGVTLGGLVQVGAETLVGLGATVRQGVTLGRRVLIGGGAMVIDDIADGERRVGVPARATR